jgi:hypothetical protein
MLTFFGVVIPERAAVSIEPPIPLQVRTEDGTSLDATVSIVLSQVSVVVQNHPGTVDLPTLRNYVRATVRAVLDIFGYLEGRGYELELAAAVHEDGHQDVFGVGIDELEARKVERPLAFIPILKLLGSSDPLRRALADLREAISSADDTGLFSYRAVEDIAQAFASDASDKKGGWERMREALRVDRTWIDHVKAFGDPQRHGRTRPMSGDERVSAIEHARKVVDRYCVYLDRGRTPLSEADFELLRA